MSTLPSVTLGVYVGPETIDAVLVHRVDGRFEPLQRFTRPRARAGEHQTAEQMAAALPGLSSSEDADYTLQVGGDWASAAPARTASGAQGDGAGTVAADAGRPFVAALKEILAECAAAGYRDVPVSFCLTAPEVAYVEVIAAADGKDGKVAVDKKRVAEQVRERAPNADPARTEVVPLAGAGARRALAVAVDTADPVTATLKALAEHAETAPPSTRLDAEATLLASLVHQAHEAAGERTVVVRVGTEDTLVLFFEGPALSAVERLRSLSAYDLPETVASRVLLQHDARKAGDPDTVYVTSTGRPEPLLAQLAQFFPNAAVEPFEEVLEGLGVEVPRDEGAYRAGALLAAAAAARELSDWSVSPDVHLLPAKLRHRSARRVSWPTLAAALLVLATLAVGVVRYLHHRAEIQVIEEDLRVNPPILPEENPVLLQARVDSLNRAYATYTRALDVLDSLLIGSDEWTQTMRLVTRTTETVGGTWLTNWSPDGTTALRLSGQSLSRDQIVSLSRRLEGYIEMIEYTDVGPRRVFSFDMLMPLPRELPQIAHYLRSTAEGRAFGTPAPDTVELVLHPGGHRH